MRPGQQNKRGRGRSGGNGRKNGNPLSRTYDSTGPDVKIRGTAQHIADKYGALARDALGAGDTVMAENYLQHAEHYNRIIAAAQAAMQERYQREEREAREQPPAAEPSETAAPSGEKSGEKEQADFVVDGSGPQPVISGTPVEIAMEEESAGQPSRRQSTRRRSPVRQRRPRAAASDGAATDGAAPAENEETVAGSERRSASSDTQDSVTEVAAAASDA